MTKLAIKFGPFGLATILAIGTVWAQPADSLPNVAEQTTASEGDFDILLRGPLHEAFAEPVNFNSQSGIVVAKEPPAPIDELPPEVKPDEEAIWIPGYWAWHDERDDFLWVSGIWRVPPQGRYWAPGYWTKVDKGYQWIQGFWAELDSAEVTYLPEPPESLERGPTTRAPSEDHFWVNGCWIYRDNDYAWRPGYWAPGRDNWVWVPAHYVWTPRGCVYVNGYWDYQLINRGMVFAPVYYRRPVYTQSGYSYSPTVAIELGYLHLQMFVRPQYSHYYFGDWYGLDQRRGIYASYTYHSRYGYDPFLAYHNWHYQRRGIDYVGRLRRWHNYFEKHEDKRPPQSWDRRDEFVQRNRDFEYMNQVNLAFNVSEAASADTSQRQAFHQIDNETRQQERQTGASIRELVDVRLRAEAGGGRTGADVKTESGASVAGEPTTARPGFRLPDTAAIERFRKFSQRTGTGRLVPPDSRPSTSEGERTTPPRTERPQPSVERPQLPNSRPSTSEGERTTPPRTEQPQPRVERPQVPNERPRPRIELPQPPTELPLPKGIQPRPNGERPQPRAERPKPSNERPQPRVERPQPKVERPQPSAERPQPKIERPRPRGERPQPKVERPQPSGERPQPKIERPQPKIGQPPPTIERPQLKLPLGRKAED